MYIASKTTVAGTTIGNESPERMVVIGNDWFENLNFDTELEGCIHRASMVQLCIQLEMIAHVHAYLHFILRSLVQPGHYLAEECYQLEVQY